MNKELNIKESFGVIILNAKSDAVLSPMLELIATKGFLANKKDSLNVIKSSGFKGYSDYKVNALKIIIIYINLAIKDNLLAQNEKRIVKFLKLLFQIKEGDFSFNDKIYLEVSGIIKTQLELIYLDDNKVDEKEALHKVDLQELFDLGYDQFLKFSNYADKLALEKGANISDLDTFLKE